MNIFIFLVCGIGFLVGAFFVIEMISKVLGWIVED